MVHMGKTRVQDYIERYSDQIIRFNPYTIKKMGLLQSQTLLKLENYMLICAPYQLSMKRAVLLVILSRGEIGFFQQFQKKITSLSLTFQKPGDKNPINLFIRGNLDRIGPVKGRANVCLADISLKNCPNDLTEIIGDFIISYNSLKSQYENFKDRAVEINEKSAELMRFNNYIESQPASQKIQTKLFSISVNKLILGIPDSVQGLDKVQRLVSKLYFQTYQFIVNGKVDEIESASEGYRRVHCSIDFSPELVEIMDDYFFRMSFRKE
ncbi:hypothetical protein ES703_28177 [subsurface metagenome]